MSKLYQILWEDYSQFFALQAVALCGVDSEGLTSTKRERMRVRSHMIQYKSFIAGVLAGVIIFGIVIALFPKSIQKLVTSADVGDASLTDGQRRLEQCLVKSIAANNSIGGDAEANEAIDYYVTVLKSLYLECVDETKVE